MLEEPRSEDRLRKIFNALIELTTQEFGGKSLVSLEDWGHDLDDEPYYHLVATVQKNVGDEIELGNGRFSQEITEESHNVYLDES